MKIAISAFEEKKDSLMNPRFGRATYFYIVDLETNEDKFLDNQNQDIAHGAGIQSAQLMVNEDVKAVISGHFGPKADASLKKAQIRTYKGDDLKSLSQLVEDFRNKTLKEL